jgi:DNA-binding MarR family transcriptional regulator
MSHLVDLIKNWEDFLAQNPKGTLIDYANWIITKTVKEQKTKNKKSAQNFQGDDKVFDKYEGIQKTDMRGSYLLSKMNQYLCFYTKPLMKKYQLHSIDDYGYLENIKYNTNITKSKACELMLQEITTGADILKRLIKNQLIKESINKIDKRQKLLKITPKGEKLITDLQIDFLQMPSTFGDLKIEERNIILNWLMRLDDYHNDIIKKKQFLINNR